MRSSLDRFGSDEVACLCSFDYQSFLTHLRPAVTEYDWSPGTVGAMTPEQAAERFVAVLDVTLGAFRGTASGPRSSEPSSEARRWCTPACSAAAGSMAAAISDVLNTLLDALYAQLQLPVRPSSNELALGSTQRPPPRGTNFSDCACEFDLIGYLGSVKPYLFGLALYRGAVWSSQSPCASYLDCVGAPGRSNPTDDFSVEGHCARAPAVCRTYLGYGAVSPHAGAVSPLLSLKLVGPLLGPTALCGSACLEMLRDSAEAISAYLMDAVRRPTCALDEPGLHM